MSFARLLSPQLGLLLKEIYYTVWLFICSVIKIRLKKGGLSGVDSQYCMMSSVDLEMKVLSVVGLKKGVECWTDNSECRCRLKLILVFMSSRMEQMSQCRMSEEPISWDLKIRETIKFCRMFLLTCDCDNNSFMMNWS